MCEAGRAAALHTADDDLGVLDAVRKGQSRTQQRKDDEQAKARDFHLSFPVFYHKVVAGHAPRRQGSGTEVNGFTNAGQAHNDAKLEEIIGACKLLRIFGNPRARYANDCNFPASLRPSTEISNENDIAALIALREKQLSPVARPREIENAARGKIGDLTRLSAGQRLLPEVSRAVSREQILERFSGRRPAQPRIADCLAPRFSAA